MMDVVRSAFVPDPSLSREAMESLQRDIADTATFSDDLAFDPAGLRIESPIDLDANGLQADVESDAPIVVGVDQAFLEGGDRALSAVVALQDGGVVERTHAVVDTDVPYVPGLLSFREGGAILAALAQTSVDPDLLVFDGSGRIHFREAGLATHIGVTVDVPSIGVAKKLLCGTPTDPFPDQMPAGTRVAIEADETVETAHPGTVLGYALQTRQYDSGSTSINPLYVSPGHRVSTQTAVDLIERCCAGYKLPEPTRLADQAADREKRVLLE